MTSSYLLDWPLMQVELELFCFIDMRMKKGIPVMAASRLERWAIILAAYSNAIKYVPTEKHGNADCVSGLPAKIIVFECITVTTRL